MKNERNLKTYQKKGAFISKAIIVYTVVTALASCTNPVVNPVVEIPVILEVIPEDEPEIIITPEIIPEEEIISMMMKPIEDYEKYAVTEDLKVFGLTGKTREAIVLKDTEYKIHGFTDFFKVGEKIYFAVTVMEPAEPDGEPEGVSYLFKQEAGEVSIMTKPIEKPLSNFVEMGITPFAIQTFNYEGSDTSRVSKDGKPTGFKMIDAYLFTPQGLWFSVPETISIRLKGIYFYPVEGNLSQSPVMSGRIW